VKSENLVGCLIMRSGFWLTRIVEVSKTAERRWGGGRGVDGKGGAFLVGGMYVCLVFFSSCLFEMCELRIWLI
jgi:hypothetical protein